MNKEKHTEFLRKEWGREPTPQEIQITSANPHYRLTALENLVEELSARLDELEKNK